MRSRLTVLLMAVSLPTLIATAAIADSTIELQIAGEAYEGAPAFEIRMGDVVVGEGVLEKAIDTVSEGRLFFSSDPLQYIERFDFVLSDSDFQANEPISVVLVNDKFKEEGWGRDRNLFVHSITVNGTSVHTADMRLTGSGAVENVNYQAGLLPVYRQGQKAVAEPPPEGWPAPDSTRSSRLSIRSLLMGTGG